MLYIKKLLLIVISLSLLNCGNNNSKGFSNDSAIPEHAAFDPITKAVGLDVVDNNQTTSNEDLDTPANDRLSEDKPIVCTQDSNQYGYPSRCNCENYDATTGICVKDVDEVTPSVCTQDANVDTGRPSSCACPSGYSYNKDRGLCLKAEVKEQEYVCQAAWVGFIYNKQKQSCEEKSGTGCSLPKDVYSTKNACVNANKPPVQVCQAAWIGYVYNKQKHSCEEKSGTGCSFPKDVYSTKNACANANIPKGL